MMKNWFINSQALLGMLLVQLFATGMQILSRVILIQGTYIFALITYRHIVGAICVAPFAFYFERGRAKKFNWRVWFWLFANALAGMTMSLGLFYYGLRDTSATYSVNFLNLIPISTFLAAIIFRMESLRIGTWGGRAKCLGAIICLVGALVTTLFKGKEFYFGHHSHPAQIIIVATPKSQMLRGTIFLVGACCSYTTWFIMQVKLAEVFPSRYWRTMLSCIMAAIQSAVIGACFNFSKEAWRLEWNLQLITIIYSGALATAATFCLMSWVISIKGPTYPSMFNPLALVFVAISEAVMLGEPLRIGTLLGMILIILGIYYFLWGKRNEMPHLPQINAAAAPSYSPDEIILEIDN